MDPNIVIKQEPIDSEEVEMTAEPVIPDPPVKVKSEKTTPPPSSKSPKSSKKSQSSSKPHKKGKEKRKLQEAPSSKEEKVKKILKTEKDAYVEPPRAEVYPDHSMSDFYCAVCDSHMNSVQVWESHIQGKRHLKNIKKEFGATSVKKEKVDDSSSDLYYIDTTGAPSPSFNNAGYERRPPSPSESRRRKWYSPEPVSSPAVNSNHSTARNFDLSSMTTSDKIDYICKLTESIYPQSESDFAEIKSIISAFSQSILQFEIRQLPFAVQQKLAKELFRGK